MQQHTVFPYLYTTERDTEQEVQCTSNRKVTEQDSHSKLSQPETILS